MNNRITLKDIKGVLNVKLINLRYQLSKLVPDEIYLHRRYYNIVHKPLHLHNPRTFNEKLQWLKIHDRNPQYIKMVDKYESKKYVGNIIGMEHIIPTIGVWDHFDDIDFDLLPEQFVLKCTHDSGSVVICKDKSKFDITSARKKINACLKENFFWLGREWPYKSIKPRIIAEPFLTDESETELQDYKFYCFNGNVNCCMFCYDRESGDPKYYFFNEKWELLRINKRGKEAPMFFSLPKPECLNEMISISSILSKEIPFVRVDLYQRKRKVLFGEMTFYPQSGFDRNYLPETDLYFGNLINLSLCKMNRR